jgi:hypothetical protein
VKGPLFSVSETKPVTAPEISSPAVLRKLRASLNKDGSISTIEIANKRW